MNCSSTRHENPVPATWVGLWTQGTNFSAICDACKNRAEHGEYGWGNGFKYYETINADCTWQQLRVRYLEKMTAGKDPWRDNASSNHHRMRRIWRAPQL